MLVMRTRAYVRVYRGYMTPPDDPALVRVLASDGTFAPTPEAERYLPLILSLIHI